MIVQFFNYTNKTHIANKLDGLSPTYSGDISPYGAFSSENVVFKLDKLYDVNFCRFEYNNHYYYGAVRINVDTDGLYVYNVTTDALTTAWYNGCCRTWNVCKYSAAGDVLKYDDRLIYKDYTTRYEMSFPSLLSSNELVIMTVKSQQVQTGYTLANPNFLVYAFSLTQFNNFLFALNSWSTAQETTEELQAKYCPSIYSLFIVKENEIEMDAFTAAESSNVNLWAMLGESNSTSSFKTVPGAYSARHLKTGSGLLLGSFVKKITTSLNFPLSSGARQRSTFNLHIADAGDFTFKYSDVSENASITSIGYGVSYDFINGRKDVYLIINDSVRKDYCIHSAIPYTFAISYDSSIVRWDRVNSSIMGAALSTATTLAVPNPITAMGAIGSGIAIMQTVMDALHEEKYGARSTVGSVGGSPEYMAHYGSYLTIHSVVPINPGGFQGLYGYPDGTTRLLTDLKGYVETYNCKLLEMGIATEIVREAEKKCDAGFYII